MTAPQQQWDITSGVGITALAVAAARARESLRPDRLINDPYAGAFVEAAGLDLPFLRLEAPGEQSDPALMTDYVGVRSRVFDDFLVAAAEDGLRQVVVLASGLDSRAFRLPWPAGTRCFELDQPLVLDFKLRVLGAEGAEPLCAHTPVPVDLRDDWAAALEAAGFDGALPTAWLAEGLLPYLPPAAEEQLFREIDRLSAPGSRAAVEHIDQAAAVAREPQLLADGEAYGIDLKALLPEGERRAPQEQLTALGWRWSAASAHESARGLGRTLPSTGTTDRAVHLRARKD
ncbi:SAM-dependent methyltransferase [Streptomyces physcomitrii]|uniref:S-adenosyl-L-methionine-dependent methyltransferase n=1 Tax=Streptomyces physcomitrii TaxID=2724184 RepID=A0ABX1GXQ2_9ACTN|nr:SAM-dependent methyltransferase [Streptomyces physcomitrii]NKI40881.1 SAM-dependent methyltransferase [Streptomyces physcomitrii]